MPGLFRRAVLFAFALILPLAAAAAESACAGRDLMSDLPPAERATLDAAVAAAPYPQGNHWRAVKDDSRITVIGTFHLYDPRMSASLDRLAPDIRAADAVWLEATDREFAQLQKALASDPKLMFTSGATLPELLDDAEWRDLSAAMTERGVPAFFAAKFQPWYVSMILAMPPCAMSAMAAGPSGMDHLVSQTAEAAGVPTHALEGYDTIFRIFGGFTPDQQIDMIRAALPVADRAEDMMATMSASYFREEHRQIWEYSRMVALQAAGADRATAEADLALMEEALITTRNRAWAEIIAREAPGKRLVVAVGAGHLAGEQGLLRLLERAGYRLERAAF
jgi:uncharacterized protein